MKLIFTDLDGMKFYANHRGDIVRKDGRLATIEEEDNIRSFLRHQSNTPTLHSG